MNKKAVAIATILFVLLLDQWLKIWVKTHMEYGEEIHLFNQNWAILHFVENNGMAFGLALDGEYGKLALSLFRILAVGFLVYYVFKLIQSEVKTGLVICFSLVLAGAIGNIIDSAIYGLIFSASSYHGGLSQFVPMGQGYAGFLHGKVVDMLYFPILQGTFPDWFPLVGGDSFIFFRPVFNIADASITTGVISILLFYRSFFKNPETNEKDIPVASMEENNPTYL